MRLDLTDPLWLDEQVEVTFAEWSDTISMPVFRPAREFTGE